MFFQIVMENFEWDLSCVVCLVLLLIQQFLRDLCLDWLVFIGYDLIFMKLPVVDEILHTCELSSTVDTNELRL